MKDRKDPGLGIFWKKRPGRPTPSDQRLKGLNNSLGRVENSSKRDCLWISKNFFKLLYKKAKVLQLNTSHKVKYLGKELRRSIMRDKKRRVQKVVISIKEKIEKIEKIDIRESFDILCYWYCKFTGIVMKPAPRNRGSIGY